MSALSYPEAGATLDGDLPAGYRYLRFRAPIGRDEDGSLLRTAGDAILSWRMHRAAGVRVRAAADRAAPGVAVTCAIGLGPLRLHAPCEVVWTVADDRRVGFGYGTLAGHPARGEECFVAVRDSDRQVWFEVTSFSVPARWQMRLAGPLAPVFQRLYAQRLGRTLRRMCA